MARRSVPPPQPKTPVLTVGQKQRRIERLRKCIQRLEAFDPQKRDRLPEVRMLEADIDKALSSAFGYGTARYLRYNHAAMLVPGPLTTNEAPRAVQRPVGAPGRHAPQAQEAHQKFSEAASRTARHLRPCRNMRHPPWDGSNFDVLNELAAWCTARRRRLRTATNPAPQRRLFSREHATVCAGFGKSEPLRFLKEMNILSAHQSSSPICPATQWGLCHAFPAGLRNVRVHRGHPRQKAPPPQSSTRTKSWPTRTALPAQSKSPSVMKAQRLWAFFLLPRSLERRTGWCQFIRPPHRRG